MSKNIRKRQSIIEGRLYRNSFCGYQKNLVPAIDSPLQKAAYIGLASAGTKKFGTRNRQSIIEGRLYRTSFCGYQKNLVPAIASPLLKAAYIGLAFAGTKKIWYLQQIVHYRRLGWFKMQKSLKVPSFCSFSHYFDQCEYKKLKILRIGRVLRSPLFILNFQGP